MLVDNANIVKNMWANQDLRISGHFTFEMLHRMSVNMILVNSSSAGKKGKNVNVDDLNVVRWTQFSLPHNPGCPRAVATPPYHTKILKIIPQPSYDHHDGFGWWDESYHHSHHEYGFRLNPWNEYGFWGKSGRISAKGYIGSSIPNLLKPVVKWYTGSNIPKWAAQAGKLTNGA